MYGPSDDSVMVFSVKVNQLYEQSGKSFACTIQIIPRSLSLLPFSFKKCHNQAIVASVSVLMSRNSDHFSFVRFTQFVVFNFEKTLLKMRMQKICIVFFS